MSSNIAESLVICGALRTPFSFGNRLKSLRSERLLALVLTELLKRYKLDPKAIEVMVAGSVQQDTKAPNLARISGMLAGLPHGSNAYTVQSNCNSGFVGLQTLIGQLLCGDAQIGIAAGAESMSNFGSRLSCKAGDYGSKSDIEEKIRKDGTGFLADFDVVDCLEEGLKDNVNDMAMIEIAEIMANVYGISRQEQDEYARFNLEKAVSAVESGRLARYMVPAGDLAQDSYPLNRKRMLKTPDSFGKAGLVFGPESEYISQSRFMQKHGQTLSSLGFKGEIVPSVTMYNSCIPGDGAGAIIVATEEKARELGLTPLLRIVSWAFVGVHPAVMGIGPCEATHAAFTKPKTQRGKGLGMEQMDVIEIHEAFAAQVLSVFKESKRKYGYDWPKAKMNAFGGSLAYTHPLGATNMRLIADVLTRFDEEPSAKRALACCCAGGGQGAAFVFERY
ncbi:MAG: thiolase family protein [Elusimicrobiota bacterium]|jgi:acetyl-CoA C-acetyltransferase